MSGSSDTVPDHLLRRQRQLGRDADDDLRDAELAHQRDRAARGLVGRDQHEVGDAVVLGREHVAGGRCRRMRRKPKSIIQSSSKIFDR